ncbi:VOC family protein, partial [Pseudomonas chlororaphis]|nr:VOC family protein [Pseudomonas chlororaphis]
DWHDDSPWRVGPLEPPYGRGMNLSIECLDAQALVCALEKAGWPVRRPVEEHWYRSNDRQFGQRNFLVLDPDGYLLRFAEEIGMK